MICLCALQTLESADRLQPRESIPDHRRSSCAVARNKRPSLATVQQCASGPRAHSVARLGGSGLAGALEEIRTVVLADGGQLFAQIAAVLADAASQPVAVRALGRTLLQSSTSLRPDAQASTLEVSGPGIASSGLFRGFVHRLAGTCVSDPRWL